ncbi:Cuticle Protein CPR RR Unclassified 25 [Frankliniella occidentalis]|nr:Cuticle Protein CPR RR Unclassified 25 [Frankliniella occidentalis]
MTTPKKALLAGAALAQQPFQGGFHPSFQPFQPLPALRGAQPAVQTGFQPFQPIQPIQPIQPLQALQPLPPLQRAAPAPASDSRTEVFGDGVETFKLVRHNQPAAQALPAQVPTRASAQEEQENLRFDQENLRIQQAQQAQVDSLRLQQAQSAEQFDQQNRSILKSQRSRQENLRFQDNLQQQQQQQQHQLQLQQQQQQQQQQLFEQQNTRALQSQQVRQENLRTQDNFQQQQPQQQQVAPQFQAQPEDPASGLFDVVPVNTPAPAARAAAHKVHRGRARHQEEPEQQVRQETRDGLNLAGLYSYSDGFFRRTVHYEADENGYRVTKEEVEPLGDGPQPDPAGTADVRAQISGTDFGYRITADDIREKTKEPVKEAVAAVEPQQHRFAPRGERV